jgi:hypothetical protein
VSFFHAAHRTKYMGERLLYANRISEALDPGNTGRVLSLVMDGMQQSHSEIPWFANTYTAGDRIKQHLQGVTTHGKRSRIYRTFNNFKGGANLAIHTLLLSLWEEYSSEGRLPRTIYVEVDGGAENANQEVKILCMLLIAMDIGAEELWLIRMPKGHNHADEDGKFGVIWLYTRRKQLLTPTQYKRGVQYALRNDLGGCKVKDVFVVPDYVSYLGECKDVRFGLADKMEYTQHVWRFQKVEASYSILSFKSLIHYCYFT